MLIWKSFWTSTAYRQVGHATPSVACTVGKAQKTSRWSTSTPSQAHLMSTIEYRLTSESTPMLKYQKTNHNNIVNVAVNLHARNQALEVWADAVGIANLQWKHNTRILISNHCGDAASHFGNEVVGDIRTAWVAAESSRLDIDGAVCLAQACAQHYCACTRWLAPAVRVPSRAVSAGACAVRGITYFWDDTSSRACNGYLCVVSDVARAHRGTGDADNGIACHVQCTCLTTYAQQRYIGTSSPRLLVTLTVPWMLVHAHSGGCISD